MRYSGDEITSKIEEIFGFHKGAIEETALENFGNLDDFIREVRMGVMLCFVFFKYIQLICDYDWSIDEKKKELARLKQEAYFIHLQLNDKKNYQRIVDRFQPALQANDMAEIKRIAADIDEDTSKNFIGPLVEAIATHYPEGTEFNKEEYLGIIEAFEVISRSGNANSLNEIIDKMYDIYIPEELLPYSLSFAGYTLLKVDNKADEMEAKILEIVDGL